MCNCSEINVDILARRAEILRGLRAFFDEQGFVEVETPVRIAAPAPEEHIDCPPVRDGGFLRASPELQMKKILAAGLPRIYQIGPCFRAGERGSRHRPEFTMLEWYRRDADYRDIAGDLTALLVRLGLVGDPHAIRRLSVREAYRRFAGWDPWKSWDADRFDVDMATKIEPAVKALGGGVFLTDYPPAAASLARLSPEAEPSAERWEFYWNGLELANCFSELCDRDEQRRRFERARARRRALNEADYPIDEAFLDCLPKMGRAAGVALGVDRLVMALLDEGEIARVRAACDDEG